MDLNRLPFIRLYDFWRSETRSYQIIWLLAMVILSVAAVGILLLVLNPMRFGIDLNLVSAAEESWLPLWNLTYANMSMSIDLPVFRQTLTYFASPIAPEALPMWIFVVVQGLGWSLTLANASQLKSRWSFGILLMYAVFLHLTGVAQLLGGESAAAGWSIEFVWIIGALIFAYAGQVEWLKWAMPWRWLVLAIWSTAPMLLAGYLHTWTALHGIVVDTYPFLFLLTIPFILFAGKDPTNLLVYLSTNRKNLQQRLDYRLVILLISMLLLLELVWLLDTIDLIELGEPFFIRPIYLFLLSVMFLPATSLNQFFQTKTVFPKSSQLSLSLLSWAIIVLGFISATLTVMDPIFLMVLERLVTVMFLGVGFAHLLFLIGNHRPLLENKAHLYFLMAKGSRFSLYVLWLMGTVFLVSAEGYQSWKSIKLLAHVYGNHQADRALLAGNGELAKQLYTAALSNSPVSPKSNHNLASLSLTNPKLAAEAIGYYEAGTSVIDFAFSRINGAQLMNVLDRESEAVAFLKAGDPASLASAEVYNNLGVLLAQAGENDSAIIAYQKALLIDDKLAAAAVNMAELYRSHERPDEARAFYQLAMKGDNLPNSVVAAGLEYELATGESLDISSIDNPQSDPVLWYHQVLKTWASKPKVQDWAEVQALGATSSEQGAQLLDMLRQFDQDSIDYALSKAEFLSAQIPERAGSAWLLLGAGYLQRHVPEMAEYCFHQAAEAGSTKGELYEAKLMMELGKFDSALMTLSELRVKDESLWEEASRERAILLLASDQGVYAQVEYDLSQLGFDDWIRIARYADSSQLYVPALTAYRKAQQLDSASILPYLQLGKLYLRDRDSMAFPNLKAGLLIADSNSQELKMAISEAMLVLGEKEEGRKLMASLSDTSSRAGKLLQAQYALADGDSMVALAAFRDLYAREILDGEAILGMFDLMFGMDKPSEANELITTALKYNRANPQFWYRYAMLSRKWSFDEDAGFGAAKAIELSNDPAFKLEVAQEFEQQLRSLGN